MLLKLCNGSTSESQMSRTFRITDIPRDDFAWNRLKVVCGTFRNPVEVHSLRNAEGNIWNWPEKSETGRTNHSKCESLGEQARKSSNPRGKGAFGTSIPTDAKFHAATASSKHNLPVGMNSYQEKSRWILTFSFLTLPSRHTQGKLLICVCQFRAFVGSWDRVQESVTLLDILKPASQAAELDESLTVEVRNSRTE